MKIRRFGSQVLHQTVPISWRIRKKWLDLILSVIAILVILLPSSQAGALMGGQGLMWSVISTAPVALTVCWENPNAANPLAGESDQTSGGQRREWVRLALKHTWEREARVIFVGWGTCQNESTPAAPPFTLGPRRPGSADENIKILITTSGGGQNPGHGSWGDYMVDGVRLNLHNGNQASYEFLAIHEFGHVLGLYHEEERTDWPTNIAGCPKQSWPPSDPWWPVPTELQWGEYDRTSVMAYCSGSPNHLSPDDIAGIQRAYQRHIPGTLLSQAGSLCLSSHALNPNGDPAFGWACDEALNDQEWHFDPDNQALYIQYPYDPTQTRRCLDLNSVNKTSVQIWNCLNNWNQKWTFQHTQLRGYGGLCLTRPATGIGDLTMENCSGSSRQLWKVGSSQKSGYVRVLSDTGSYCLTLTGTSGSSAQSQRCNSIFIPMLSRPGLTGDVPSVTGTNPIQVQDPLLAAVVIKDFKLAENGSLVYPSVAGDLCLDVQDVWDSQFTTGQGGPVAGQRVQFFNCLSAQLNQKWMLSGNILSGTQCLELDGTATTDGAAARVTTCDGTLQQKWDYVWKEKD